jgi:hypothetical protein
MSLFLWFSSAIILCISSIFILLYSFGSPSLFVCLSPLPSPTPLNLSYNNIVNSNDRWLYQALPACLVFILLFLLSSDALHNDVTPESKTLNYFKARRFILKAPCIICISYSTNCIDPQPSKLQWHR